jgi:alpha-beta hydrolase superfamily lysophospholipase
MENMSDSNPPFSSSDAQWSVDSIDVNGTLVTPPGAGPFPAVLLVAGSGPTDRDWCSPLLPGSNGSARLLAEELARSGFATLRFDKRASGPHARQNAQALLGRMSMRSHEDEVAGAVRTLAARPEIRRDRLFALGNSEGTIHVLHHQLHGSEPPFAGLVLAAPPGRSVGVVARSQIAAQLGALPDARSLLRLYDEAIARFVAGEPAAPDPSLPPGARALIQSLEAPVNLPFARELWTTDAASLLGQVSAPVLVVIGKKDLQVDWQLDGEALERAAAGRADVTFRYPESANHVLKLEPRPRAALLATNIVESYNGADARLDPQACATIIDWLRARL